METEVLVERLKNLSPVKIHPRKILNNSSPGASEAARTGAQTSMGTLESSSKLMVEAMDSADIRRLKAANYGKWYIRPGQYNRKLASITDIK